MAKTIEPIFTNRDVYQIIEKEHIGYAVQSYCRPEHIKDPEMAKLWKKASTILNKIEEIANKAWEEDEESDDDHFQ